MKFSSAALVLFICQNWESQQIAIDQKQKLETKKSLLEIDISQTYYKQENKVENKSVPMSNDLVDEITGVFPK